MQGYRISTDKTDLDFEVIYGFISKSYWASGIPKQTLEKAISTKPLTLTFRVHQVAA